MYFFKGAFLILKSLYTVVRGKLMLYMCVYTYTIQILLSITDTNLEQLQCYLHGPKLEQTVVC